MARFVKGDIVVVPFPFSGTSDSKRRPAVVLKGFEFQDGNGTTIRDYAVCMITIRNISDPNVIQFDRADLENGVLDRPSTIRPTYLFATSESRIVKKVCNLTGPKVSEVVQAIVTVLLSS